MKLPTFEQSKKAIRDGAGTALHRFIYDNEPAGADDELKFRKQLKAVVVEAQGSSSKSNGTRDE